MLSTESLALPMSCNKHIVVSRIRKPCDKHSVLFFKYVFNKNYASHVQQNILHMSLEGLSDSVRQLIISRDPYDCVLVRMLLKAF